MGSVTTKGLPAASTAAFLSPVAMPDGSGLGPSSAKQGVASPANNPAARRRARPADTVADNVADNNDGRRDVPAGLFSHPV